MGNEKKTPLIFRRPEPSSEARINSLFDNRISDANSISDPLLTVEQVAVFLNVALKTIYDWTYQHKIPFIKLGKLTRFKRSELESWLASK